MLVNYSTTRDSYDTLVTCKTALLSDSWGLIHFDSNPHFAGLQAAVTDTVHNVKSSSEQLGTFDSKSEHAIYAKC